MPNTYESDRATWRARALDVLDDMGATPTGRGVILLARLLAAACEPESPGALLDSGHGVTGVAYRLPIAAHVVDGESPTGLPYTWVAHEDWEQRARVLDQSLATGAHTATGVAPDPYEGTRHRESRKRSRKGTTTRKVHHYGPAIVIGDTVSDRAPIGARLALESLVRSFGNGRHGGDVLTLTQRIYRDELPRVTLADGRRVTLLGNDRRTFEDTTVDLLGADVRHVTPNATHRAGLDGSGVTPDRYDHQGELVQCASTMHDAAADRQPRPRLDWPDTTLTPVRIRNSERRGPSQLAAPSVIPGHIWIGHAHVKRGQTVRDQRAAAARRVRERTTSLKRTNDLCAISAAFQSLTPGKRITGQQTDGTTWVASRSASRCSISVTYPDGTSVRRQPRTVGKARETLLDLLDLTPGQ